MVLLEHHRAQLGQALALPRPHVFLQIGLADETPWQAQTAVGLLHGARLLGRRHGRDLLHLVVTVVERLHGSHNPGRKLHMAAPAT